MSVYWRQPIVLGNKWTIFAQTEMLSQHLEPLLGQPEGLALAKALLNRFRSLPSVLAANGEQLRLAGLVEDRTIKHLHLLRELAIRLASAEINLKQPILGDLPAILRYFQSALSGEPREQCRVLYLDKKLRLIAEEFHSLGTVDHVWVQPVDIARSALLLNASAVILVHNHPSGDPQPSRQDLVTTQNLIQLLDKLKITVCDHFIIGEFGHISLRTGGYYSHPTMLSDEQLASVGMVELNTVLSGGTTRGRRKPNLTSRKS